MSGAAARGASARGVAVDVLVRVLKDDAFSAAALDAELGRAVQLSGRDAALATELVQGVLRFLPWLEGRIGAYATHDVRKMDLAVRATLLVGAYQLFFLERVPAFAAVSEAVSAVRSLRGPKVAAFANAVLRRLSEEAANVKPSPEVAFEASVPAWIKAGLQRALGDEGGHAFLAASVQRPRQALCVGDASERDAWVQRLAESAPSSRVEPGQWSPHAIVAQGLGRLADLPGHGDAWIPQEEGSQLVALALGARPGERVLDACAGRGNKASLLARAVAPPSGALDAADLHASKLERLELELGRRGLRVRTFAVDWTVGVGAASPPYDAVLVDAPCTGTGTLQRRPDLLLRRTETSLRELVALQSAILSRAAGLVRPGGRLVYAVCSVLREEGEGVTEAARLLEPSLTPAPFPGAPVAALAGAATTLRLTPHQHGTDGYFLASFVRATS